MMDAKTMIYFLKPDGLMKDGNRVVLLADEIANEISDYIEQQEKYAELGRLAVNLHGYVCTSGGFGKWKECDGDCKFISFCQKRSELLAEERE
jgi:hypothetical protein